MEKKNRQSKDFGEIWNTQTEMDVSQETWSSIFHNYEEPWKCADRKRPLGCHVCDVIDSTGVDSKGNSFIISIVGDVHSNIPALLKHSKKNYNQIICIGDMAIYTSLKEAEKDKKQMEHSSRQIKEFITTITDNTAQPFKVPVRSILGNHDNFVNLHNKIYENLNFDYMENGKILNIGNLVIATLGGIFSPKRISCETSKLKEYSKRFFTEEDINSLISRTKNKKIDILITHQAASGVLPEMRSNVDEGSSYLTKLLRELKPKYYIHGHHHKEYTSTFENTKVIGLGNFKFNTETYVDFNTVTGEIVAN